MELVVQHKWPDPQRGGRLGRDHQRRERIDLADMVVGVKLLVPKFLRSPRERNDAYAVAELLCLEREAKAPDHGINIRPPDPQERVVDRFVSTIQDAAPKRPVLDVPQMFAVIATVPAQ